MAFAAEVTCYDTLKLAALILVDDPYLMLVDVL